MNKIPNENWQTHMLRSLCAEETVVLLPEWCGRVAGWVGRILGGLFALGLFACLPWMAFEMAAALLGL